MDWATVLKVFFSVVAAFSSGWATAVLSDVSPEKAIASGVVAAGAYWLGQQQTPAAKKP
jgi:hypothetical protein